MNLFRPKKILNIYSDFDGKYYYDLGFKLILLDIDNTIAIPNTGSCDAKARAFIENLQNIGFKVVIFSNNTEKRVKMFIGDLNVEYNYWSFKPLPFSYFKMAKKYGAPTNKIIVIGDQLLTDILGANLSGCYGIYSKQLIEKDSIQTKINRFFERIIWRIMDEKM